MPDPTEPVVEWCRVCAYYHDQYKGHNYADVLAMYTPGEAR